MVIEQSLPFEYYLFIDNKKQELSINCENIDSFTIDDKTKRITLEYNVPETDLLGRRKGTMEKKIDYFECAEGDTLITTFTGIRTKVMLGQHEVDQKKYSPVQKRKVVQSPKITE